MSKPALRKSSKSRRARGENGEWSINAVAVALAAVIAFLGWAFAAASYAHAAEGWRSGVDETAQANSGTHRISRSRARAWFVAATARSMGDFFSNSIAQIPKAPSVVVHVLRNAKWLIVLILLLELLVVLYVWYARKLQLEWKRVAKRGNMPD